MKMNHLQAQKKQTQTNPISPTPKGVKQNSDSECQRSYICLLFSFFCPWATNPIFDPKTRTPPKMNRENLKNLPN